MCQSYLALPLPKVVALRLVKVQVHLRDVNRVNHRHPLLVPALRRALNAVHRRVPPARQVARVLNAVRRRVARVVRNAVLQVLLLVPARRVVLRVARHARRRNRARPNRRNVTRKRSAVNRVIRRKALAHIHSAVLTLRVHRANRLVRLATLVANGRRFATLARLVRLALTARPRIPRARLPIPRALRRALRIAPVRPLVLSAQAHRLALNARVAPVLPVVFSS